MRKLKTISESIKEASESGPKEVDASQYPKLPTADEFVEELTIDGGAELPDDIKKLIRKMKRSGEIKVKTARPMKMGDWYEGIDENTWYEVPEDEKGFKYRIQQSDFDYEMIVKVKSIDAFK